MLYGKYRFGSRVVEDVGPYNNVTIPPFAPASNFLLVRVLICGSTKALPYDIKLRFGSRADFREHMECSPTEDRSFYCRGEYHPPQQMQLSADPNL